MNAKDRRAATATALLSAPVLRSAMEGQTGAQLAKTAVGQLLETDIGAGATTVRTLIWRCDRWLARNYRNDHVYRKAVVGQMVPSSGGVLLAEFKANKSIVDFLVVTDVLHAVEIKSDLDNTSRLPSQLSDYSKIAPLVSLLGTRRLVERVESMQEFSAVGLSWLDPDGKVQQARPAIFNATHLDSMTMMRSLRRAEYLQILTNQGIPVPELPNTRIFSYAREAVLTVDPQVYQNEVATQLQRRRPRVGSSAIAKLPTPLRPTVLKLDPTKESLSRLHGWLDQEIQDVYA